LRYQTCFALIFLIALVILAIPASAQTQPAAAPSYQAMSDKFFEMLQQDKSSAGIDYLFDSNPSLKKQVGAAEDLKAKFSTLRTLVGPYFSHALLVESKVAGIYVYQYYFVAYERQPISVRIAYYKPGSTWQCQSLQFNTDLEEAIRSAADDKLRMDVK
jgi:alpha-amylase/alpha-mannosidase (GH57 family)